MANKSGIHIKKSHEGRFTKKGISVKEGLSRGGNTAKQANFARMARRHWKPLHGGIDVISPTSMKGEAMAGNRRFVLKDKKAFVQRKQRPGCM